MYCDNCGELPNKVDGLSVNWKNPETGVTERISATNTANTETSTFKVPIFYALRSDCFVEGSTREQAQRAADWLLAEYNKQNLSQ